MTSGAVNNRKFLGGAGGFYALLARGHFLLALVIFGILISGSRAPFLLSPGLAAFFRAV